MKDNEWEIMIGLCLYRGYNRKGYICDPKRHLIQLMVATVASKVIVDLGLPVGKSEYAGYRTWCANYSDLQM